MWIGHHTMSFPMTREELQLLPAKICEERRQKAIENFKKDVHVNVVASAKVGLKDYKVRLSMASVFDQELMSAILFRDVSVRPFKMPQLHEMEMIMSILKINLGFMYPDSTVRIVNPNPYSIVEATRGPHILIDWS